MFLSPGLLVTIIAIIVSTITSIALFFLSQYYLISMNRDRFVRYISRFIEFTPKKGNGSKKKNLKTYFEDIQETRKIIYILYFFLIVILSNLLNLTSYLFLFAFLITFVISGNWLFIILVFNRRRRKSPYDLVFKSYPITPIIYSGLFSMATLSYIVLNVRKLSLGIIFIALIYIFMFILAILITSYLSYLFGRTKTQMRKDLITDLFNFFHNNENYTESLPFLVVWAGGSKELMGTVIEINRDVLVMEESGNKYYINWEDIVSFKVSNPPT